MALWYRKTFLPLSFHYENMPIQYSAVFHGCKYDNFQMKNCYIFIIITQNIDCGYTFNEAVLTSTHNLCFRAKVRKSVYPCKPQFYYVKLGCKGCTLHGHVFMMSIFSDMRNKVTLHK